MVTGGVEMEHDGHDEGDVFSQEFWDERYAAHQHVSSGRPNQRLVEVAGDLPPGLALDVGCGEGADVVWLAESGWRATGADVSVVALRRRAGMPARPESPTGGLPVLGLVAIA